MHVPESIWSSAVREKNGHLMCTFRAQGPEVPSGSSVVQVCLRITLLGVDEVWELNGVSDEKNGGVVTGHIPVTVLSVELDSETSGIAISICRPFLTCNSGKSCKGGSYLTDRIEHLGFGVLGDVVGDLEVSMGSSSLGMDHPFGDALAVEVSQLIKQMEVAD
jgi:hypothetical protein